MLLHRGVWRGSIRGAPATATGNPRHGGNPRLLAPLEGPLPESRLGRGDAAFEAGEEAVDVVLGIVGRRHRPALDWG